MAGRSAEMVPVASPRGTSRLEGGGTRLTAVEPYEDWGLLEAQIYSRYAR
jgi:hypothetical protein